MFITMIVFLIRDLYLVLALASTSFVAFQLKNLYLLILRCLNFVISMKYTGIFFLLIGFFILVFSICIRMKYCSFYIQDIDYNL